MERPGPLFVCENTVEHTSWGSACGSAKSALLNKEKRFSPDDF